MNDRLAAALRYADRGWKVIPLHWPAETPSGCSCYSKRRSKCTRIGKHPRTTHGLKDGTTDEQRIRAWWKQWPAANVGLVTGAESGFVVLDVDPDKGGEDSLVRLEAQFGSLPVVARQLTGGEGLHYLFTHPGVTVKNQVSAKDLGDGLDVRGDGGYIVAAPSKHASGGEYAWLQLDEELPPVPGWLLERVREQPPPQRSPIKPGPRRHDGAASRYGIEALDREVREVAGAVEGTRNHTLNRAAFNIGQLVAGGEVTEHVAREALREAAISAGLEQSEIEATISSGLGDGAKSPRTAPEKPVQAPPRQRDIPNEPDEPPPDPPDLDMSESADDPSPDSFDDTDLGNARRLVRAHGHEIRYVPQWESWLVWDGRRWARDQTGEVERMAKRVAESILVEAVTQPMSDDQRKRKQKFAFDSQNRSRIAAMIALARTEPIIPVEPHQLDAGDWDLNVANGTIDLRTGELRPHDPAQLITKLAPVVYDPNALSNVWDQFLETATDGNVELISFLSRAVGYSLTGSATEEVLFFVHGPGASGKSTFLDSIESALGEYARRADFETFLARNQVGGPRGDIARLAGARFVNSVEVDEGKKLAEGLVKTITGGDVVTAAYKYRDEFEYRPQFKLWLAANHAPKVRHGDTAMWRRILRVPFEHVIPLERRDPAVKMTLRDSQRGGPAILAWAVHGCRAWLTHGLQIPDTVSRATESYRADQDPLRDWLEDECTFDQPDTIGEARWVTAAALRKNYDAWADENGQRMTLSPQRFRETLEEHGATNTRRRIAGKSTRIWEGVGLRGSFDALQLGDGETSPDPIATLDPSPPEQPTLDTQHPVDPDDTTEPF